MELLKVSNKTWRKYQRLVRGNKDISKDLCTKKLTRNYMLGNVSDIDGKIKVYYGNLIIGINKEDMRVISLDNNRDSKPFSRIDKVKKEELNTLLGIIE